MWRTCVSTVFGLRKSVLQMPSLEWPSAISASTSRSRSVSSSSGLSSRGRPTSRATIVGSRTHSPSSMRSQRVDEHGDVRDALLEQVAGALGVLLEQAHRVARLEVVREHEHADLGMRAADLLRGDEALVGVRRRHRDVDDRDVRARQLDASRRARRRVAALPTTSSPASASSRARPSRRSVSSSAITTRTAAPRGL